MADTSHRKDFEEQKRRLAEASNEQQRLELIDSLISEYRDYVRFLARPMLSTRRRRQFDSEDVCQTICRRVAERLQDDRLQLLTEPQFRRLLKVMVRNLVIDRPAKESEVPLQTDRDSTAPFGAPMPEADGGTPSAQVSAEETRQVLLAEIQRILQPDEFYLFRRHVIDSLSYADLASEFDLTPDAVRMRINRAVTKLRTKLSNFEDWLDD